jgi:hypothetical protein
MRMKDKTALITGARSGIGRKHRSKNIDFDAAGPAGGNPNVLLSFGTKEQELEFPRRPQEIRLRTNASTARNL